MDDCRYDTLKLLYTFCKITHFIDKHAKNDAKKSNDEQCYALLNDIEATLNKYIEQLNSMICK
jgi:hypothetical protein